MIYETMKVLAERGGQNMTRMIIGGGTSKKTKTSMTIYVQPLRKISEQLTWQLVLLGGPVKKETL